jgi:hypothetical protein
MELSANRGLNYLFLEQSANIDKSKHTWNKAHFVIHDFTIYTPLALVDPALRHHFYL